jgi:V/A-type H+-transporting ATPase subunit F
MEFKRIIFIGDRRDALGLRLAGINDSKTLNGKEALEEVIRLIKSKEYNLIITEENIKQYANQNELMMINSSVDPLVLLIPNENLELGKESIESLARRVLGVDITKFK